MKPVDDLAVKKIHFRSEQAAGKKKPLILYEPSAICGHHRKHAIRRLNGLPPGEQAQ